ncbi:hypothetical protein BDV26DRAFT_284844 [Aspergillus bertholletiae]|uniref:Uncharacterized protein n=1 Tax=Aspergillus bertholletiae TaxID=1226010 RepID=A0A5N7AXL0_9EURO|nr:hypothetical protein BDV26DRAFT_284844 [Aspergillus bertholletiae]
MVYPLRLSNPRAIRLSRTLSATPTPAPQWISSHALKSSTQVRNLWGCSRQRYGSPDTRAQIRITRYQRLAQSRTGSTPAVHPRQASARVWSHQHHRHPWWNTRWGWTGSKSSAPGSAQNAAHPQKSFWEVERARMQQRMEQIQKEIAADPYKALFGGRLPPLDFPSNVENRILSACRSIFGVGKADKIDKNIHVTQTQSVQDHEYDPIRGRMVPKKSSEQTTEIGGRGPPDTLVGDSMRHDDRIGYLSVVDRSKEYPNEDARAHQSARKNQADPPDILGKGGTTLTEPHQRPDSLERPTSEVESHMKEQRDSDRRTQADVSDSQKCSGPPELKPDHYKPTSFAVPSPAQQQEPQIREEKAEDLDLLRASDIRSLYNARDLKDETEARHQMRKGLDAEFDSYVDPVGDIRARDIRARFQEPAHAASVNGAGSGPAMLESTTQLHSEEDSSNTSPLPVQEEQTGASLSTKQACGNAQVTTNSSLIGDTYRVLAYDPLTLQITRAETHSSFHTPHELLHPAEILPRLNNPSKFLPYFAEMQADGYEIVSGGGDLLVFRKAFTEQTKSKLNADVRDEPLFNDEASRGSNTASAASPAPGPSGPATDVPPQKGGSRAGKILRRMFIGGFATAATCYALGVVSEYFRTGGQDGRGIDGFTEFESERRHRDRE